MQTKNRTKVFSFIAGLFILLYVVSYLLLPNNNMEGSFYKKANNVQKEPRNSIDYASIGDSECTTSISPMEIWRTYGYSGYNCGIAGQQIQDTYYGLERLLKRQSPKIIFMEANTTFSDIKYINALTKSIDEGVAKIFPIYKYHNSWKYFHLYMLEGLGKNAAKEQITVYKGYQYSGVVRPYTGKPYVSVTDDIYPIGEQPLIYLNKIVSLCKENNIKLILYSTPSPKSWSYSKHNAMSDFAKENDLEYIDLNLKLDELGIDWSKDSRDNGDHLNYFGAKKITAFIGKYLSETKEMTDHRNEKEYESWNKELPNYLKLVEQK